VSAGNPGPRVETHESDRLHGRAAFPPAGSSPPFAADPEAVPSPHDAAARKLLLAEFEALLAGPGTYEATVRRECRAFPERDLLPYILPALAYTNLGQSDPAFRPKARRRVAQLIDLARPAVARRAGKLEDLDGYRRQAVYLGQYNLALGGYRLLGGDDRYARQHKAISDALHAGLVRRRGRPLQSYPTYSWTFDTIPCLLSLKLYDRHTRGTRSRQAIARHLQWISDRATHEPTALPYSRVYDGTGEGLTLPRGCELSWRIALLADLDADLARRTYANYVKAFWLERPTLAGFAEWPFGRSSRQDFDSGPVVMGIGTTASGFGIAAARAAGDETRRDRLCRQAAHATDVLKLMIARDPRGRGKYTLGGVIDPDGGYRTGFLFGDACLFYAVTWRPWCSPPPRRAGERKAEEE